MKSTGLVQIFRPVKETNRTHSQSYVEDLSTKRGRKRCANPVVLDLSVLPKLQLCTILLLLAAALIGGCGLGEETAAEPSVFYRGTDGMGVEVVLPEKPQRVVSLGLATDEILLAIAPPEQIAALTAYADDPGLSSMTEAAKAVPVKLKDRSPERVLALHPDLVFTTDGVPKELVESLRDLGLTVYASRTPKRIEGIFTRIEEIGRLTGQEENAAALIAEKRARLADVERRVGDIPEAERPIIVAFAFSGVFGQKDGLFDDMCRHASLRNGAAMVGLTADTPVSMEQIVALDPDVFLLPTWSAEGEKTEDFRQKLRNDPLFMHVKAVRENHLYTVPDTYRYSAGQNAIECVYELARAVYPERFADVK